MSEDLKQLSACLARYMDTKPFTAVKIGKEQAERMKVRREIATKRARAAIRFFEKPENFARLSARIASAQANDRFENDEAAKLIYGEWSEQDGWVPWVERGNSDMQELARLKVQL